MEKIKVFHVITKLEFGGAQGNTLYTCSRLDKARFAVSLVCGPGGRLDDKALADGYPVYFVPHLAREINPVSDAAALFQLYRLFRKHRPDIVHTHSSKAGILGRIAAWLAGVRVVIHTFHGFGFTPAQRPLVRSAFSAAEKLCSRLSGALIFVSRANMDEAAAIGFAKKAPWRVIRSGIKLSDYPAQNCDAAKVKASLDLPPDARYVICVGNFKPQKNPLDFVRMAEAVLRKTPDVFFVYTGEGALRPEAEKLAHSLGIKAKLRFPGWRTDTPCLLACAEAFVLASLWEGLPRALVEALKTGLPCAAYGCDGVRDLLRDGENGFVVAPGDVNGLAARVSALLADKELREKIIAGARAADLAEFDIDNMVSAQEKLYLELVDERVSQHSAAGL